VKFPFYSADFEYEDTLFAQVFSEMYFDGNRPQKGRILFEFANRYARKIEEMFSSPDMGEVKNDLENYLKKYVQDHGSIYSLERSFFPEFLDFVLTKADRNSHYAHKDIAEIALKTHPDHDVVVVVMLSKYGLDIHIVKQYFDNIKKIMNLDMHILSTFLMHVGCRGIKNLANGYLDSLGKKVDRKYKIGVRRYSEVFSDYVKLLCGLNYFLRNDVNPDDDAEGELGVIFSILNAAFREGLLRREENFYLAESLREMSRVGTSQKMKESWANRNKDKFQTAIDIAESLWRDKDDPSFHNEMTQFILQKEEFKDLPVTTLMRKLKKLAKNYDRVRGLKKDSNI